MKLIEVKQKQTSAPAGSITAVMGPQPLHIDGNFYCERTKITSLAGAPQHVGGSFYCSDTKITSLANVHKIIKQVNGQFWAPKATNMLGLLLIRGIKAISVVGNDQLSDLLTAHIGDVYLGQQALLDAGYVEQARL